MYHKINQYLGKLGRLYAYKSATILTLLIGLILIFTILSPRYSFISYDSLNIILSVSPMIGIITLGMAVLIIAGEFDLSCGSVYAFGSMVVAVLFTNGVNPIIAICIALVLGTLLGWLNGIIVIKTNVSSLLVTLGSMWVYRGIVLVTLGGFTGRYYPDPIFTNLFAGKIFGLPIQFLWLIVIAVLLWLMLEHTHFGNWIFATGSNKWAARSMGVNTNKVKIICFSLLGFLAAFAGVLEVSRISLAFPLAGQMTPLTAISGAVIGGTYLGGGSGTVLGGLFGALVISVLDAGLITLGFSYYYLDIAVGILLIIVAALQMKLKDIKITFK